jgi:GNAT superfamily N-acetyltransferase
MVLRNATHEEWRLYGRERPEHVKLLWSCIIEEDGEVRGHGFIVDIDGTTWLTDLEIWAADQHLAVARMYLKGRRFLQKAGRTDVYTHVKAGSRTHRFYLKQGFQEGELVLRGQI